MSNRLEGLFESVLQRMVLLFEQFHLLLFDGEAPPQGPILLLQAFQFNIPLHEHILPEPLLVGPTVALLGEVFPFDLSHQFPKGETPY